MKKIVLLLLCLLLNGCNSTKKEPKLYGDSTLQAGFDTIITLKLYAKSEEEFQQTFQKVTQSYQYFHKLFDKYNDYNMHNIKTINDSAGKQPVEVDQTIIDLLLLSKHYSELSNNQFNITLGPVLNIWHDVREKAENNLDYTLPTQDELKKAAVCSGWDKVEIDDEKNTVYLTESCASLDVGAVAKGYATQLISEMLIEDGYTNGFIDAGGNIQFLGSKINNEAWVAGIQTPSINSIGQSLVKVEIDQVNGFVTSGDYQRYFIHQDEVMHHIIDPDTLYPSKHARSVTILTKNSAVADILSTTLYTMDYHEGLALINQLHQNGIQAEVIWIYDKLDEIQNEKYIEKEDYYILTTENIQIKTE